MNNLPSLAVSLPGTAVVTVETNFFKLDGVPYLQLMLPSGSISVQLSDEWLADLCLHYYLSCNEALTLIACYDIFAGGTH